MTSGTSSAKLESAKALTQSSVCSSKVLPSAVALRPATVTVQPWAA